MVKQLLLTCHACIPEFNVPEANEARAQKLSYKYRLTYRIYGPRITAIKMPLKLIECGPLCDNA